MRVSIEHTQKTTGIFSKKTHYIVSVAVEFSQEEKHILKGHGDTIVLERKGDTRHTPFANEQEAAQLSPYLNLRISDLIKGKTDSYSLATPAEAKDYDNRLRESLQDLKNYILANTEARSGRDTFEL